MLRLSRDRQGAVEIRRRMGTVIIEKIPNEKTVHRGTASARMQRQQGCGSLDNERV